MSRKKREEEHENHERWMVSYADFVTLLFAFFTVLYTTAQTDQSKLEALVDAMNAAFEGPMLNALLDSIGIRDPVLDNPRQQPSASPPIELTLRPQLTGLLSNNPVQVGLVDQGLSIDLPGKILFANGSAELHPASYPVLAEIADTLAETSARVEAIGYATRVPFVSPSPFEDNLGLATARALATARYLAERGMVVEQLAATGRVCADDWPDDRSVTLKVTVDHPRLAGEILEKLRTTSMGDRWN